MSRLDYWHPVVASRDLHRRPMPIRLDGRAIVLFRTENGEPAAIDDQCAHRRMKLSLGNVQANKLVCPYHGWSFDRAGQGESPSAPKMHACITSYDCAESAGVLWIKSRGTPQVLPQLCEGVGTFVGAVFHRVAAPLELVIDNFSEVEHTVTMHPDFGFDPARASEAVAELEPADDSVTMRNRGPAKLPPLDTRLLAAVRRGDHFHAVYTFRFDPPQSFVTHFWTAPDCGRERMLRYNIFHFFVPEDSDTTKIVSFGFLKIGRRLAGHFTHQLGWFFRRKLRRAVDEDAFLLKNLADKSPGLEGMKLSRFDSILGLTRDRLRRIYDGG